MRFILFILIAHGPSCLPFSSLQLPPTIPPCVILLHQWPRGLVRVRVRVRVRIRVGSKVRVVNQTFALQSGSGLVFDLQVSSRDRVKAQGYKQQ